MLAACGDDEARARECEKARAELRPDAEELCRRSSSRSSSSSSRSSYSWVNGRSGSDAGSSTVSSSARGGFGSSGAAHASSGG